MDTLCEKPFVPSANGTPESVASENTSQQSPVFTQYQEASPNIPINFPEIGKSAMDTLCEKPFVPSAEDTAETVTSENTFQQSPVSTQYQEASPHTPVNFPEIGKSAMDTLCEKPPGASAEGTAESVASENTSQQSPVFTQYQETSPNFPINFPETGESAVDTCCEKPFVPSANGTPESVASENTSQQSPVFTQYQETSPNFPINFPETGESAVDTCCEKPFVPSANGTPESVASENTSQQSPVFTQYQETSPNFPINFPETGESAVDTCCEKPFVPSANGTPESVASENTFQQSPAFTQYQEASPNIPINFPETGESAVDTCCEKPFVPLADGTTETVASENTFQQSPVFTQYQKASPNFPINTEDTRCEKPFVVSADGTSESMASQNNSQQRPSHTQYQKASPNCSRYFPATGFSRSAGGAERPWMASGGKTRFPPRTEWQSRPSFPIHSSCDVYRRRHNSRESRRPVNNGIQPLMTIQTAPVSSSSARGTIRNRNGRTNMPNLMSIRTRPPGPNLMDIRTRPPGPNLMSMRTRPPGPNLMDRRTRPPGPNLMSMRTRPPGPSFMDIRTRPPGPNLMSMRTRPPGPSFMDRRTRPPGPNLMDIRTRPPGPNLMDIRTRPPGPSSMDMRTRPPGPSSMDIRTRPPGPNLMDIRTRPPGPSSMDMRTRPPGPSSMDIRTRPPGPNLMDIRTRPPGPYQPHGNRRW
ncbi:uncharacterized protein LOC144654363 [Oculina patagonica]